MSEQDERIERLAALVHQAYLDTCERLGWPVKPENQVPYEELAEDSKELDRASVRAVINESDTTRIRAEEERDKHVEGIEALGGLHGLALEEAVVHLILNTSAIKVKRILPDETRFTRWG